MLDVQTYQEFLQGKITFSENTGVDIASGDVHESLKPHQRDTVVWAMKRARGLIAQSFGLGKTRIQIDLARQVVRLTDKPFLVVCPLGVKHQFVHADGPAMGTKWEYVTTDAEVEVATTPYLITNYERIRDGGISAHHFGGVSLDEGATLRDLGSKTYQTFADIFSETRFRFVCTATPSPNNYIELLNYAEFLGVMDRGQALTRWFKRNPDKAGDLTLYQSQEREFWMWVASWALFLYKPSDLGYSDEGYELPELKIHWHRLPTDHTRAWGLYDSWGQYRLMLDTADGITAASAEARETVDERLTKAKEIIKGAPNRNWLLWHHLEAERHAIQREIPDAVTVYGSQPLEKREAAILDFSDGKIKILATKPSIAGSGCNFQYHCSDAIFMAADYKFFDFIQAVHRIHRFLQDETVNIHIVHTEAQDRIVEALMRKWQQHDELTEKMQSIVKRYGLSSAALKGDLKRTMGVTRQEKKGDLFKLAHNDTVFESADIPDDSVGFICTSIPFGNHYEYTTSLEDFGHTADAGEFFKQMDFVTPNLYRMLKPGRLCAVHVKDRILYGHQTDSGIMEVYEFSDDVVKSFRKHGFLYQGRRTIVTDVVRENNSTYRLGWSEMCNDASKMGSGLPEYVLLFRKPPTDSSTARADEPVTKDKADYKRSRWQITAHQYWRSNGNGLVAFIEPKDVYDFEGHVERLEVLEDRGNLPSSYFYEPPVSHHPDVWEDISFMQGLNARQGFRKRETHICPLPFDIVRRLISLYSNPGDVVYDPFSGLGTVPYVAIEEGRYGYGVELNADYWSASVEYCQLAEDKKKAPTLFDWAGVELEMAV